MGINVKWIKSTTDTWLPFETVNLSNVTTVGVYVIWKKGPKNSVVYVGQGDIADRLICHRSESNITRHGPMLVTWASVDEIYLDGVERFLADKYSPLEGDRHPIADPIAVNLIGK